MREQKKNAQVLGRAKTAYARSNDRKMEEKTWQK